jgi:hypothetical protein
LNSMTLNSSDKVEISSTSPGFDLETIVKKEEIPADVYNDKQAFIRAQPQLIQRAIKQRRALELLKAFEDPKEKLTIFEEGVALGIVVGSSTKEDVANLMQGQSKVEFKPEVMDSICFYHDISVNVFFNPSGIVNEVQFGSKFKGATCKGLRVGDTVDKAIELYGQPRMKAARGAMWNHFSVFSDNNIITCIRIQS